MPVSGIHTASVQRTNAGQAVNSGTTDFAGILDGSLRRAGANLDDIFSAASKTYGVPVSLLKSVAKAESNFNPAATSGCGAMGVMQLMPSTAKSLGVTDAYDPEQNIMGGAKYLSQLLRTFDGNTELAVAAYNAGPGNVRKYGGIPPFQETQNYVAKVMGECGGKLSADTAIPALGTRSSPGEVLSAAAENSDASDLVQMALMSLYQAQMTELDNGSKIVI